MDIIDRQHIYAIFSVTHLLWENKILEYNT